MTASEPEEEEEGRGGLTRHLGRGLTTAADAGELRHPSILWLGCSRVGADHGR
jgi:hypothetical protein